MFICLVVLCTHILRNSLMENTNKMGLTLVENYSSAEEGNISTCESILTISVNYIEEREQDQVSFEELREGLYPFMNGLTDLYGSDNIQIYGKAMNGTKMISNNPEIEAMTDLKVEERYLGWQNGFMSSLGTGHPFLYCSSLAQDSHTDSSHHICFPNNQKEVGRKRHPSL